jgi:hypothetical protein
MMVGNGEDANLYALYRIGLARLRKIALEESDLLTHQNRQIERATTYNDVRFKKGIA